MYRNNFSISSEYDGLESDRDDIVWFRGETDETKALDRETARCSMASVLRSREFFRMCRQGTCEALTATCLNWTRIGYAGNLGLPAVALGVICHVAVQKAVTSILVALLLSLIYYQKSYEK